MNHPAISAISERLRQEIRELSHDLRLMIERDSRDVIFSRYDDPHSPTISQIIYIYCMGRADSLRDPLKPLPAEGFEVDSNGWGISVVDVTLLLPDENKIVDAVLTSARQLLESCNLAIQAQTPAQPSASFHFIA